MNVLDRFRLEGRIALVTGCRRGIGLGMARALAQAGADVIGLSASLEEEGSEVDREVRAVGRSFHGYRCDVGDRAALHAVIDRIKAEHPRIDILVANAGTIERGAAAIHTDEQWDRVIEVNLSSQFVLARELGVPMLERGEGKVLFTASLLTFQGGITVPGYAASKGGVGQLVKALSNEWAPRGVNVNAIAPGYIATDNTAPLREDPDRNRALMERVPAGRWGSADDLAGATVFLCSRASDFVHGEILTVDGGWMGR
jgi:2-dehydro-3-deoxy-D-gluconate 5-dehydrogenase